MGAATQAPGGGGGGAGDWLWSGLGPVLGSDSADLPGFGKQGKGLGWGWGATPERHQWVLRGGAPCPLKAGPTGRAGG